MKGSINIGGVKDISESPLRVLSGPPKCEVIGEKDITYNFDVSYDSIAGNISIALNNIFPASGINEVNPPKPYPHAKWVMDTTYTGILPVSGTTPVRFGMAQIVDFNARLNIGHAGDFFSQFLVGGAFSRILLTDPISGISGTIDSVRYYQSWPISGTSGFIGPDLDTVATIDFSSLGTRTQRSIIAEQANYCDSYFAPYFFRGNRWNPILDNFSQIALGGVVISSADVGLHANHIKVGTFKMRFRRTATVPLFAFSTVPPLSISFSNKTFFNPGLGLVWDWDFGDGSPHSNQQNPTHSYPSTGTYKVTLKTTDPAETKSFDQIVVLPLKADFTYVFFIGTVNANLSVTDRSIGAVTWDWDTGDGAPHQHTQNFANYHYPKGQTFIVTLTVGDGAGKTDSISKVIVT